PAPAPQRTTVTLDTTCLLEEGTAGLHVRVIGVFGCPRCPDSLHICGYGIATWIASGAGRVADIEHRGLIPIRELEEAHSARGVPGVVLEVRYLVKDRRPVER